ncbi:galactose mutarotase-like domain-containing protein [Syncephalis pseudoplumigaleata]|uniref:Glucose-6-phosphate 1-epimerase n=1 Tax=Syncephalis pseudoplumigaleata TaxID=1712513 RepID=A0A4V1J253_9FUNG|nr:galactose mutarotase-like domain-containing protein [Syncephalis pseudoplumigaleata]|eukprot:RKP27359.1 galactose mutarotase-like domain-containing protein [Syncephalis pseudoplumigaleata]
MPITQLDDSRILVELDAHGAANSVVVHRTGATVVSWRSAGKERLFLSKTAVLDGSKAIRGGIPLVFPQFGKASDPNHPYASFPQHGFARTVRWWPDEPIQDDAEAVQVQLHITEHDLNDDQRRLFPYAFRLSYVVRLARDAQQDGHSQLTTELVVWNGEKSLNDGGHAFDYQALLHTYFRVPDVANARVVGLAGQSYVDKVAVHEGGMSTRVESAASLQITGETDRVYQDVGLGHALQLHTGDATRVDVQREGGADVVVWNPGEDKAAAMADLHPAAQHEFLCVEVGHVRDYRSLPPGQTEKLAQTLTIRPDTDQKL